MLRPITYFITGSLYFLISLPFPFVSLSLSLSLYHFILLYIACASLSFFLSFIIIFLSVSSNKIVGSIGKGFGLNLTISPLYSQN